MKKSFSIVLCFLFMIMIPETLITSFFPYNRAAAQTGAIGITGEGPKTVGIPGEIVAEPCKQVTIPFEIDEAADLAGLDLDLRFDPNILILADVERTSLTNGFLLDFNDSGDGLLRIILACHTGITSGSGALINLIFNIKSSAILSGSTEISIEKAILYNENADPLESIIHQNEQMLIQEIRINIPEGWSMISLPALRDNTSSSSVFPGAVVIYKYERGSGYIRVIDAESLEIGRGYWILLNDEQSYQITGQPIQYYSLSLYEDGWDLIGGCTCPAQAMLHNGKITVIYQYVQGVGYQRISASDSLEPGKGYWILYQDIVDDAELTVAMP